MLRGRQPATREPILYGFSRECEKKDKTAAKKGQNEIENRGIVL